MKRSFFLVSLSAAAWSAGGPRTAWAAPATARVQIVRRSRLRFAAVPGGCANHRRRGRWASFTAADFA
jgi:hypothetical protein